MREEYFCVPTVCKLPLSLQTACAVKVLTIMKFAGTLYRHISVGGIGTTRFLRNVAEPVIVPVTYPGR